jgi:ATP citrate (pro-S)-lyase
LFLYITEEKGGCGRSANCPFPFCHVENHLTCSISYSDQLIKRRGKAGLLLLNADWPTAKAWIEERAGKETKVETIVGRLSSFIIEPFLPHPSNTEYYVCINSSREGDQILFTHEGGIEVGDVDAKALKLLVAVDADLPSRDEIKKVLLKDVPAAKQDVLVDFLIRLYSVYVDLHFACVLSSTASSLALL